MYDIIEKGDIWMKKILLLIFTLCLLGGCFKFTKGEVITKSANDVLEKFENKESFVLYVGNNNCESCSDYRKVLQELIVKYEIEIIYLDTLIQEQQEFLNTLIYDYLYRLNVTPSTYLIKDGKTIDMKEGNIELIQLEEWLIQYEYLPK